MADLSNFDPNSVGQADNNIFGLPFTEEDAELVLLPVPWEVTTSYRGGTSMGPQLIYSASMQIDLYDPDAPDAWKRGIYMQPINDDIHSRSELQKAYAQNVIRHLEGGGSLKDDEITDDVESVNTACMEMVEWIKDEATALLNSGKKVGLVGGDHSTPLGFMKALGEVHESYGILQVDAHADLRESYEGFTYSHASIMYNALQEIPQVSKLVQVGIRDYCDEELLVIRQNPERIATWFDQDIKGRMYEGDTWKNICDAIIDELPQKVYISFDIDGLDPKLCPGTGTPVPGGFEFEQVNYLFRRLVKSGRQIIGFDLNEVSTGGEEIEDMNSITGARALYKLCNFILASS